MALERRWHLLILLGYAALLLGQASVLGAKELWKAKAPNSCKFFIVTEPPQK
jgi:hypothetical protein